MDLKKPIVEEACAYALHSYSKVGSSNTARVHSRLTSTTAYVIRNADLQIVVFRGTNDLQDWVFNISAFPYRYKKLWCHGGFVMAHKSVWKRVRRLLDPHRRTIVCGHSLGGALAELSAHCMRDFTDLHLVAFGKPNVFFKPKSPKLKHLKTQLSFVHGSDIVPRLPRYLYGADKGQTLVYFDSYDYTRINPDRSLLKADWMLGNALSDHRMEEYVDLVRTRYFTILPDVEGTGDGSGESRSSI